ncbi:MAG: helix-turn-helix transcriptional regulator [Muribaculaceae bacterium]|nr:helix-turn-helix transcriptional regulator [Muribaculaceae bacterium]
MGMTPIAFLLQVRLNYASNLIVSDDTPLTTIAQRCGFNNLSHFSKMFKQQFGVSPQQYRKSNNDMNLINNPRMNNP